MYTYCLQLKPNFYVSACRRCRFVYFPRCIQSAIYDVVVNVIRLKFFRFIYIEYIYNVHCLLHVRLFKGDHNFV